MKTTRFRMGWRVVASMLALSPLLFAGCQSDGGSSDGHTGHSHGALQRKDRSEGLAARAMDRTALGGHG